MNKNSFTYRQLQNNTFSGLFVGHNIITLKTIDSTNNYLKNELSKSAPLPDGTVILAEEQFAGRGQRSNTWLSEPGKNLTFSLLLHPAFISPDRQFMLNKCVSIAVNEALTDIIGDNAKIKWPNDMQAGNAKIGGILIENIIRGVQWKYAIIGIGLNVNQVNFPSGISTATSISKILQSDYELPVLLSQICRNIESWYLRLKAGRFTEISAAYLSRLYRLGEVHRYRTADEGEFSGTIINVTDDGWLEVESGGAIRLYTFKEIEFLTDN